VTYGVSNVVEANRCSCPRDRGFTDLKRGGDLKWGRVNCDVDDANPKRKLVE
jgi:hypothetical protein